MAIGWLDLDNASEMVKRGGVESLVSLVDHLNSNEMENGTILLDLSLSSLSNSIRNIPAHQDYLSQAANPLVVGGGGVSGRVEGSLLGGMVNVIERSFSKPTISHLTSKKLLSLLSSALSFHPTNQQAFYSHLKWEMKYEVNMRYLFDQYL